MASAAERSGRQVHELDEGSLGVAVVVPAPQEPGMLVPKGSPSVGQVAMGGLLHFPTGADSWAVLTEGLEAPLRELRGQLLLMAVVQRQAASRHLQRTGALSDRASPAWHWNAR